MGPFLTGFADELMKRAAQPLEVDRPTDDFASPVAQSMSEYAGSNAKTGLKGEPKVNTPILKKALPPHPMTTPNQLVGIPGGQ